MRVVQKILYLGLFFTVLVIFWLIFIQQMLDVHKQVVSINTATNRPPLIFSAQEYHTDLVTPLLLNIHSRTRTYTQTADDTLIHQYNHSSYLLALGYSEQISAAVHSVLQLSRLAQDWGAQLVEPTIVTSHIFGINGVFPPMIDENPKAVKDKMNFFDIFNASAINEMLHSQVSPHVNMTSFQDFTYNAPRNITILHFNTRSINKTKRLFALSQEEVQSIDSAFNDVDNKTILHCDFQKMKVMKRYINRLEEKLNTLPAMEREGYFRVVQVLCLNPLLIYRSDILSQHFASPGTFIFTNWHGCSLRNCSLKAEPMKPKDTFRYTVLTHKEFSFHVHSEHKFHHTSIDRTALTYLRYINYTESSFLSIHIRAERIIRKAKSRNYEVQCMNKLLSVLSGIENTTQREVYKGSHRILMISDLSSEYGTDSCSGRWCSQRKFTNFYNLLRSYFDFHSYQPDTLNTTKNSGFVSLVEMHMLASGRNLVSVGSWVPSGFQNVLQQLFLSKGHTSKDLYHISC